MIIHERVLWEFIKVMIFFYFLKKRKEAGHQSAPSSTRRNPATVVNPEKPGTSSSVTAVPKSGGKLPVTPREMVSSNHRDVAQQAQSRERTARVQRRLHERGTKTQPAAWQSAGA